MRTIRNLSFFLLVGVSVLANQVRLDASFSCPSECWYQNPWGFGWFCDCYMVEDCSINYPSFCQDFFSSCNTGTCNSGANCAAYCTEGMCC